MSVGPGATLRALGVRPSKRLGQNFLVDPGIAERIVAVAEVRDRPVLEIGPGLGALTDRLAEEAKLLTLVEIDARLAEHLAGRFSENPRVRVIRADALAVDFDDLVGVGERARVVANLPYRVGSQILFRLYDARAHFDVLVAMLQKEVADRVVAEPGRRDYGPLAVWTALWGEARTLFRVPRGAFLPTPKVDSVVIRIGLRETPRFPVANPRQFRQIVRASFGQRRKMLRRALEGIVGDDGFAAAGIDPRRRGETLALEEFVRLADASSGDRLDA